MKARGRKTTTRRRKARPSRTTASPRRRKGATAVTDIAALRRDLAEAQEQQAATADVLRIISTCHGDLEPVFKAMLANAVRICGAKFGTLYRYDGETFHLAALHNAPREFAEAAGSAVATRPKTAGTALDRADQDKAACAHRGYLGRNPHTAARTHAEEFLTTGGRTQPHLRADAQGRRADRRHRNLPAGGPPVHRQADRAGRISPSRPSSPSRTPDCSTNCANAPTISPNRWSSRPRPRKC